MIAVDDLRDTVGFLENFTEIPTPNIDRLAASGMSFGNAHCAAPACAPSRTAIFTGLSPATTGVYENGQRWPDTIQEHITLTKEFMQQGYYVAGSGKNYHGDGVGPQWHTYFNVPYDKDYGVEGDALGKPLERSYEEMPDTLRARYIIEQIAKASPDAPSFFSVGIVKPHLPFNVPKEYFDRFPLEDIPLPPTQAGDLDDLSPYARMIARGHGELGGRLYHSDVLKHDLWRKNIQAYMACVAYADDVIGEVLDAWEASPLSQDGIVILWGDHGWHLGEKEHWSKFTLWRVGTRVPFIIRAPGVTEPGSTCDAPVNLLDLFPTLIDLTHLPKRRDLDGHTLLPLLRNPTLTWDLGSVTYHGQGNASVHSGKWHAIYYRQPGNRELYDLEADPNEFHNLADQYDSDPEIRNVLNSLYGKNIKGFSKPASFYGKRSSKLDIPE